MGSQLPSGTVTFLFTDIEGSTNLLRRLGDDYAGLLEAHHRLVQASIQVHGGQVVDTQGDAFFVSFPGAIQAVAAAAEIQRGLREQEWPQGVALRVRMGLHTGEPQLAGEGYVGMDVHRAARIAQAGHGGQVLLSVTTTELVRGDLPPDVELLALGSFHLKDMERPEPLSQLVIPGLPDEFPPLKASQYRPPGLPAYLDEDQVEGDRNHVTVPFVGRLPELARLEEILARALSGQGCVAFISGGAGRGKTALAEAFSRRAMESRADLLVASGFCNPYSGLGDPYLPFRDVLSMLTGDVEARWRAGGITTDHARRLWEALPVVLDGLAIEGPTLASALISGENLLARSELVMPGRSKTLRQALEAGLETLDQVNLLDQFEKLLRAVAGRHPLILTLDDLQWADSASLDLLFHLGRRLAGARILILGNYRPEEVALGRGGQRHPLEKILAEFKRQYGEILLGLGNDAESQGREFVNEMLDSQPNRLSKEFREALYRHTGGHPLFTVELLRDLQERGDLIRGEDGRWLEGGALNWTNLPARVEGVIEERIGRLEAELRETLTIASVEGEDFTAQVVARVQAVDERGLVRKLSRELDQRHRLVGEQGSKRLGQQRLYLYRFRHSLFQQHLYNGLSPAERTYLHQDVGEVLERLYGDEQEKIAPQLGWHYSEAGDLEKAVRYLLLAGDRARDLFAYPEAIGAYQKALNLLKGAGDQEQAAGLLLKLGGTQHLALDFPAARRSYEEAFSIKAQIGEEPIREATAELQVWHDCDYDDFGGVFAFDPGSSNTLVTGKYLLQLFSGLVELSPDLDVLPHLARYWEVFDGGKKFVFHLRDDFTWTDGQAVTSHDFIYAWRRLLDKTLNTAPSNASLLFDIQGARECYDGKLDEFGARAIDDHTIEIELERPTGHFLFLMTHTVFLPVPRHVIENYGSQWTDLDKFVTNGAYTLEAYKSGTEIVLARNPAYPGRFNGNIKRVKVAFISEPEDAIDLYRADNINSLYLYPYSVEIKNQLRREFEQEYYERVPAYNLHVAFNQNKIHLQDAKVRQAFVHAVDRVAIVNRAWGGYVIPALGGFIPPAMPAHSPDIGLDYDPELARQLFAQAGYPGGHGFPKVRLLSFEGRHHAIEPMIAAWNEVLNIQVELDLRMMEGYMNGIYEPTHDLLWAGWAADYPDADSFLRGAIHWIGNWNQTYTDLVEQARQELNHRKRQELHRQADRLLTQEAAVMPVDYHGEHFLLKPWVRLRSERVWTFRDLVIEPIERK